jgi:chromate reductase
MRVLGIAGSLRKDSWNRKLLLAAAELLPEDIELEIWDGLKAVPPYDEDDDGWPAPSPVAALRDAIARADAVLVATPEYNGSVPGQLKNALDWASRPFAANVLRFKPAAVVGTSTGAFGAVWAQAELRKVLSTIGARVIEGDLALAEVLDGLVTAAMPRVAVAA